MKKSRIFATLLIFMIAAAVFFLFPRGGGKNNLKETERNKDITLAVSPSPPAVSQNIPTPAPSPTPATKTEKEKTNRAPRKVPFIVQAPNANWDDQLYQNACEEAVTLMADAWLEGQEKISTAEAREKLEEIADLSQQKLGFHLDQSAADTAKLLKLYAKKAETEVKVINSAEEILKALNGESVVILPMNGRKLNNPFYTPPGPERHMILIKGYNPEAREFIVNDPGTKRGKNFRYSSLVVFNAIRDYPSGYHKPFGKSSKKMIVVKEEQL